MSLLSVLREINGRSKRVVLRIEGVWKEEGPKVQSSPMTLKGFGVGR